MRPRFIQIGNSRGVRIPKSMITRLALGKYVDLKVRENEIIISKVAAPRAGWAQAAEKLVSREDMLLDEQTSTCFDREEWK